jgi:hypothetical protein
MTNQKKHLLNLKTINLRRLKVLELQAAHFGSHVPPHIILEIEDIKEENSKIDIQLNVISENSDNQKGSQKASVNQIRINGNVSGSTIVIGNENTTNNSLPKK